MERKEHCIKVHKFPKKYRFDNTSYCSKEDESNKMEFDTVDRRNRGKKKPTKIFLNKNQKSKMFTKDTTSAVCKNNGSVETISSTTVKTKTTSLVFIPRQVQEKSFSKILTNNQNREKNVLESDTMMELADTLPD